MTIKPVTRRLIKEYTTWLNEPLPGVYLKPDPHDIHHWRGVFEGPKGTPYEKGVYHFEIIFPTDYPFKMYNITISTKIHHINVDSNGKAWLIDPNNWSPALTARHALITLMDLIANPDVEVAMSQSIYDEWADDRAAFDQKARMMRDQHASGYISDFVHWHDKDPDWTVNYVPIVTPPPSTSSAPSTAPTFSFGSTTPTATPVFGTTTPAATSSTQGFSITLASQTQLTDVKARLRSEYEDLLAHPVKNAVAAPSPENPLLWTGVIDELYGTPYENDLFKFEIVFSSTNSEPLVRITSPIKHPSIFTDSPIRIVSLLSGGWNPNLTVSDLLRGLVGTITKNRA